MGDLPAAEESLEEARAALGRAFGPESLPAATVADAMGVVRLRLGQHASAAALHGEVKWRALGEDAQ